MARRTIFAIVVVFLLLSSSNIFVDTGVDIVSDAKAAVLEVGPGKTYSSIQAAVDAAEPGDTVFVYNGTYHEYVDISKTINLTGENKNSTFIDGISVMEVIKIHNTDYVNISGFTITDGLYGIYSIFSNHSSITDNNVINNQVGMVLENCNYMSVIGNYVSNSSVSYGIVISQSNHNIFENNTVFNNTRTGIYMEEFCYNNTIRDNYFIENWRGIELINCDSNFFINNSIKSSQNEGIRVFSDSYLNIFESNIIVNNDMGIVSWVDDRDTNFFINCTISNSTNYDFQGEHYSHTTFINVSFNKSKTHFHDEGTLKVQWFLNVNIVNPDLSPAIGARFRVTDNNNGYFRETYHTWYDGWKRWIVVTEYHENAWERIYYTPYNISAWTRNLTAWAEPKMEASESVTLILGEPVFFKKLYKGWNLISIPLLQNDNSTASVLSSVAGKYDAVEFYNGSEEQWHFHPSGDLTIIDSTMGIWVHMTEDAVLSLNGTLPIRTPVLLNASGSGWNLIGYPTLYDDFYDKDDGFKSLKVSYDAVQAFETSNDDWRHSSINKPPALNDLAWLGPGCGYWVHAVNDAVIEIGPVKVTGAMDFVTGGGGLYVGSVVSLSNLLYLIDTELVIYDSSLGQSASQDPILTVTTLYAGVAGVDMDCTFYDNNGNNRMDGGDTFRVHNGASGDTIALINRLTGETICMFTIP